METNKVNNGFELTHEAICRMTPEDLIRQTKEMQRDYERKNKPQPEDVKGIPTWLRIHGEKRYCLHYPSKSRKRGPVFFDIHGGGFVWGYPEEDDLFCARMNEVLDVEIYSLEYPRTAEHRFPEAFDELYDTIKYMAAHGEEYNFDPEQIAIGGHSAGGNLTAAITLKNRKEKNFPIKCQILAYPGVSLEDPSLKNIEENPLGLTSELMELFAKAYVAKEDSKNIYCCPLLASREEMKGLPPAVVLMCERDPIKYQDREYVRKLLEANVEVLVCEFAEAAHAFEVFPGPLMEAGQDYLIRGFRYFMGI